TWRPAEMSAPPATGTLGDERRDGTLGGDVRAISTAIEAVPEQAAAALRRLFGAAQVLGTTVAIQGIGVCTGALAAHMLSVDGRGQLAAVLLWATIIGYAGDLGLPLAYVYETARDRSQVPAL